jgi:hypothetical protein
MFSFQFHPGRFISPPLASVAFSMALALWADVSKYFKTETIPGISDHDIVYTEFDFRPVKLKQKPRIIPLYNKANWNNMKNDITSILDQLLQMFRDPDCNVNTMWEFFKQTLSKSAKREYQVKCICKTRWLVY